jgi:hypothetical protein
MALTLLLVTLKLLHIYVQPANPLDNDDQKLATCVVEQLTARPSELEVVKVKEQADVVFTVENQAKFRIHVVGTLRKADGSLLGENNHVTKGFNHSLCHQAEGLLNDLAKQLSKR